MGMWYTITTIIIIRIYLITLIHAQDENMITCFTKHDYMHT